MQLITILQVRMTFILDSDSHLQVTKTQELEQPCMRSGNLQDTIRTKESRISRKVGHPFGKTTGPTCTYRNVSMNVE